MKKKIQSFLVFALTVILMACAPQVTVTSEVTVTLTPLPTEPPIPTPTFHPQFSTLQTELAEIEGYELTNDGMIEFEGDTIPGIQVTADGNYAIVVGGDMVMLEPEVVTFGSDGEIKIDGYEQDADGNWLEAISEAVQAAYDDFADLGYLTEGLEFREGEVTVSAYQDGVKVYERNIKSGVVMFDQNYVIEQAGQQDLMPTDIEPRQDVLKAQGITAPANRELANSTYFHPLFDRVKKQFSEQFGHEIPYEVGLKRVMIDSNIFAWGTIIFNPKDGNAPRYLVYELGDSEVMGEGTIIIVPLMPEK